MTFQKIHLWSIFYPIVEPFASICRAKFTNYPSWSINYCSDSGTVVVKHDPKKEVPFPLLSTNLHYNSIFTWVNSAFLHRLQFLFLVKLILFSECLLEDDTVNHGDVFTPKKKANCKEECFHLAVGNGSPFWTYNKETKWCHFRVTSNTKQHTKFWSGNTDSSCSYSNECGSKSNFLFF